MNIAVLVNKSIDRSSLVGLGPQELSLEILSKMSPKDISTIFRTFFLGDISGYSSTEIYDIFGATLYKNEIVSITEMGESIGLINGK